IPTRRRKPLQDDRLGALSKREKQVLSLLPRGLTNASLAAELGIAPGTVKVHVERILQKLEVKDRTQAAVYAVQSRLAL
ncbi:DNA-binding response regulator, partial [Xanthomonas oryzae pv. oryzae]